MTSYHRKPYGGPQQRFKPRSNHNVTMDDVSLSADHRAVVKGTTLFPHTVTASMDAPRLLVSGINNSKIGGLVLVGAWKGFPIYTLTLEERKTCPRSCHLWRACYGNSMHFSRRHVVDGKFWPKMYSELARLSQKHPKGFVVRLHVLGDFIDDNYVLSWLSMVVRFPALHIFGYTAHAVDSQVGTNIHMLNLASLGRVCIRFSVAPDANPQAMQATTVWHKDAPVHGRVPEGLLCPMMSDKVQSCGSCGICWNPNNTNERIVFLGHGNPHTGKSPRHGK